MKKFFYFAAILALTACDDNGGGGNDDPDYDYKITAENRANWLSYARNVASLLAHDAADLHNSWAVSYDGGAAYSDIFKQHQSPYTSAASCIEQIIEGCADIANEVGEAKIGDPYDLYLDGRTQEALFAVESWYSFHSRQDYSNNIISIRNSYYGTLDNSVAPASISTLTKSLNPELDEKLSGQITTAYQSILAIPDPFRNNIDTPQTRAAMTACANLESTLTNELIPLFNRLNGHDAEMQAIVENYVDAIVLPTYSTLASRTVSLQTAINTLVADPSDANFEAACNEWISAREPWECSEAFLFGPVDALGLDPNMDSWPLDVTAIINHINSGDFGDLEWDPDDDDERVEAAQNVRGFHTLEFLLFSNGQHRTIEE